MKIKKIKDLSKYEGEFIVTDGKKEVMGSCISLPLPENRIPEIGTTVACLQGFFLEDNPIINKIYNQNEQEYFLKKKGFFGMSYHIRGCVIDSENYLVKVFGFTISLEYIFGAEYGNRSFGFNNGDWISFDVDRFDITL